MTNKEAIRRIKDHCETHFKLEYPNAIKITEALNMAIKALEQQEKDRWIPVSDETNPTKNDVYMVTFEEQGKRYVERFYFSSFSGWLMPVCWKDEGYIEKLIAWKPMPDEYKGEI